MTNDATALVRGVYQAFARGDMPAVLGAMAPDIVWNEAENFPYADRNPYREPQAVLEGVFMRIGADCESFSADADEIIPAGETVIALGRYRGKARGTGAAFSVQFAHVWRVKNGRAAAFQQYADTFQMRRALGRD